MKIWQNELHIIGKRVRVKTAQNELEGIVFQIDDSGALMIETTQGIEKVLAGDVHTI
jgi:biotin-(acetyl-CoA carboxylase) ligase